MNMDAVLVHDTEGLADDWPALNSSTALKPLTLMKCLMSLFSLMSNVFLVYCRDRKDRRHMKVLIRESSIHPQRQVCPTETTFIDVMKYSNTQNDVM